MPSQRHLSRGSLEKRKRRIGLICGRVARAENFKGHARPRDLQVHKCLRDEVRMGGRWKVSELDHHMLMVNCAQSFF
jgi:hypothetical protein